MNIPQYELLEGLNMRKPTYQMLQICIYPAQMFIKDLVENHKAQLNANEWGDLNILQNKISEIVQSLETRLNDPEMVKLMQSRKEESHNRMLNPYEDLGEMRFQ